MTRIGASRLKFDSQQAQIRTDYGVHSDFYLVVVNRLYRGLKQLEREDDYSSSPTDEIKNVYLHFP